MSKIITQISIPLPDKLSGITEDNFWRYITWQSDKKTLKKDIIAKFKEGAFATISYNDDNRPDKVVETPLSVGNDLEFVITTKPTTKRPSYSKVNEVFGNYLNFLLEQYEGGDKRRGVITIHDEPYILLSEVVNKLNTELKTQTEGREGIEQGLKLVKPLKLLEEIPENVSIVFNRDYSALTDYNGRNYVKVGNFLEEGNTRTSKWFKKELLNDSLKTLDVERPENVSVVADAFEDMIFIHQLEPRSTPKHGDVISALMKGAPKRIATNSKIGDLTKVSMMQDEFSGLLQSKGLIDDKFIAAYKPIKRGDKIYIRLNGLIERFENCRKTLVTPGIEQNISFRPTKYNLD